MDVDELNKAFKLIKEYFKKLEENNKIIEISNKDVIHYEGQVIKVRKGQKLILQFM